MEPYDLLLHEEALEAFRRTRGENRRKIKGFFNYIPEDPFIEAESTYEDAKGRIVSKIHIGKYLIDFQVDHAVKEIKILELSKIDD